MRIGSQCSGFTFIELVATLAIVGVLSWLALPVIETQSRRVREAELRSALRDIRRAIDSYKLAWEQGRIERKLDQSGYPPSLEILVDGVVDARDPKRARIYFLRRIPGDPFSADPSAAPGTSWGKRSYRSDPDTPTEGEDVFDVYSFSNKSGLNGVAYRRW